MKENTESLRCCDGRLHREPHLAYPSFTTHLVREKYSTSLRGGILGLRIPTNPEWMER